MVAVAKKKDKCECGKMKLAKSDRCNDCYRTGPNIGAGHVIDRAWDKALHAKFLSLSLKVPK